MIILAIDTSCDDTSIAIVEIKNGKINILSNIVSSQEKIHKKYGGVYPTMAKREHIKNLPLVLKKALRKAGMLIKPKVNVIAVTNGPGLEPCLYTGVNFAKALSHYWNLPIIPVNHIEGHILANWLTPVGSKSKISSTKSQTNPKSKIQNPKQINFPAVCLVVSGGHTQLILMKKIGEYKILGETRDDAAGESFDKTARILGLGYPGGPAISGLAEMEIQSTKYEIRNKSKIQNSKFQINSKFNINLPRPMLYSKDYDFSFSGLKTAALYDYKKRSPKIRKSKQYIQAMCAEIQQAVIDVLIKKTIKAAKDYRVKTIMLGGGVAANQELRQQFQQKIKKELTNIQYLTPNIQFCTDNAAMIGITAYFHRAKTKQKKNITVNANLRI